MMHRRSVAAAGLALVVALFGGIGCTGHKTRPFEVGHHCVRFKVPQGWEHLDHGRQQLLRAGESQLRLEDLGPATTDALVREVQAAQQLWRAGRREDAFQRVRDLRGPSLQLAPSQQRAGFWRPWTDATAAAGPPDSLTIETALASLIVGADALADVTPANMLQYVLELASDPQRREIGSETRRTIHGLVWTEVELWDRVSHLNRTRVAFLENHGHLLVLAIDRGPFALTGPGFEAVLASLEVVAGTPAAR